MFLSRTFWTFVLSTASLLNYCCFAGVFTDEQLKGLGQEAMEESVISIRPGEPDVQPFWNAHARRFIYAPSFNFKTVGGAERYRFTVTSAADNKERVFLADEPWASLAPVWRELPVGEATVRVEGLDAGGAVIRESKLADRPCRYQDFDASGYPKVRKFWRAAVFSGGYHDVSTGYRDSAVKALKHLYDEKHFQKWAIDGQPDASYTLYCYPSKTVRAVVDSMMMYSKVAAADSARAIEIAEGAANYLMEQSEPGGLPLEYMPPTYEGSEHTAERYAGQIMMIYPAEVADTYLDLYEVTKKDKYLRAAKLIAATYRRLQLPSGTWHLKIDSESGKPVGDNLCVSTSIVAFFDRLADKYGSGQYRENSRRAFEWIMANPVRTFNWEGQFEDVEPSRPYQNLARGQACAVAMYLLDHSEGNEDYVNTAEELLRFVEDQFVIWEKPFPTRDKDATGQKAHSRDWIAPCVLEQYGYYVPIDASAATMIAACQKAYEVTGKKLYLAKACALAETMVFVQDAETGWYRTYWWKKDGAWRDEYWLNCASYDIKVMLSLADVLENRNYGRPVTKE
jgi:hypothetical protein